MYFPEWSLLFIRGLFYHNYLITGIMMPYGNISSPTVLYVLEEIMGSGLKVRRGPLLSPTG